MSIIYLIKQLCVGQFVLRGGGGGGGYDPTNDNKIAEQNRIQAAVNRMNNLFGDEGSKEFADRSKIYDKVRADSQLKAMTDLNKDRDITERDNRFDLASSGLSGGSRDVDTNKDILDLYQQGVLKASNIGADAATSARAADEATRVKLVDSIRSGLDEGSAVGQAYQQMSNNAQRATVDANNQSLSGFFDRLNNANQQRKNNAGMSAGMVPAQPATGAPGTSKPVASSGTVRASQ